MPLNPTDLSQQSMFKPSTRVTRDCWAKLKPLLFFFGPLYGQDLSRECPMCASHRCRSLLALAPCIVPGHSPKYPRHAHFPPRALTPLQTPRRSSSMLQSAILTDEVEALLGVSPEPFQPSRSTPRTTNRAPAPKPPCLAHGKLEIEHGGGNSGRCRTSRLRPPLGSLPLPFFLFHGGGAHAMLFRRFPCPSLHVHHCLPRRRSGHLVTPIPTSPATTSTTTQRATPS